MASFIKYSKVLALTRDELKRWPGSWPGPTTYRQQARAAAAYPENEILSTLNATTSLLSTGMLDREKQAKKQQDTEYEGAGGRAEELETTV